MGEALARGVFATAMALLAFPPVTAHELAAPSAADIDAAIHRGVEILLAMQESLSERDSTQRDEWPYEGIHRESRQIPFAFRVGGTSVCAWSLIEVPGWHRDAARRDAVERSLRFVLSALEHPRMSAGFKRGYDVRGWGHAYALTFLCRLLALERVPEAFTHDVEQRIVFLIAALHETEIPKTGGWNYSRREGNVPTPASPFMTAATLQALLLARERGFDVRSDVVERALDTIENARLDTGAFQYGTDPKRRTGEGFEAVPGAVARMPICESTLYLAGRGNVDRIRAAIAAFFEHWKWLEARRGASGTHRDPYMVAPYYFFFGHYYAAQAIELLPGEERPALRAQLAALLWVVREASGGWNDREFARSENFGTAMALLSLARPTPPPSWRVPALSQRPSTR